MEHIRSDISNMITPSWLTYIPTNLGEANHGKLKADQWRTLGVTYLPVSLIRLWDSSEALDDHRSQQCRKLLSVTLSLISAIMIASSRSTSAEKADLYSYHMTSYINGLRELLPRYKFRPNHHMALHLGEYLRFYGPVYSWWAFPFERLIGMLQRIPNNFQNGMITHQFYLIYLPKYSEGKLEETISLSFDKSAGLRALLLKEGCPQAIQNCSKFLTKLIEPKVRNTLLADMTHADMSRVLFHEGGDSSDDEEDDEEDDSPLGRQVAIPEGPYRALQTYFGGKEKTPKTAKIISLNTVNGLTFSTYTRHKGNSYILVRQSSPQSVPARIETMVQISKSVILYVVRFFLRSESVDVFAKYPTLKITTWSKNCGQLVVVDSRDVETHFACLAIGSDHIAVVSLSRVRLLILCSFLPPYILS